LLKRIGVDALVVALVRDRASEEHDALRWERDENVLHRLDRIALTGITARIHSRVVEALDRLALDQLCPSDRLVGIGEPKTQRRAVKCRRHDHDLRIVGRAPSAARRRSAEIGSLAITRTFITALHYLAAADGRRLPRRWRAVTEGLVEQPSNGSKDRRAFWPNDD
jgi:hypothetical protein